MGSPTIPSSPFPQKFQDNILKTWGEKEGFALLNALTTPHPTSIRLNPFKIKGQSPDLELVKWCERGYYLPTSQSFTFDPKFQAGVYYVQEASSMFLEQWIKKYVSSPSFCLDMCAAPGGKTTHLLSLLPKGSFVVANEPIASRTSILVENLSKWGVPNVMITQSFPEDFAKINPIFDVILTDVPCSGEGMFRKDPQAVEQWSERLVQQCAERQRKILLNAWNLLKMNGILIYSTCTFNTLEDEEMMQWAIHELGAEPLYLDNIDAWGIVRGVGEGSLGYHLFPHRVKGEGLYMCGLRKLSNTNNSISLSLQRENKKGYGRKKNKVSPQKDYNLLQRRTQSFVEKNVIFFHPDSILPQEDLQWYEREGVLFSLSKKWSEECEHLSSYLRVVQMGMPIATYRGKQWQPHPAWALSTQLNPKEFPSIELNWEEAISYLRGETLACNAVFENDFVLLTYKSYPLGWAKKVENRLNNLYPSAWRIRSTHAIKEDILERI